MNGALTAAADELRDAERYRLTIWSACVSYVESKAEDDDLARGLAGLVADADRRASIAKLNARFVLPATPERTI